MTTMIPIVLVTGIGPIPMIERSNSARMHFTCVTIENNPKNESAAIHRDTIHFGKSMTRPTKGKVFNTALIVLLWISQPIAATETFKNNNTLFFDDFNYIGDDVNRSVWKSPEKNSGCFGRTVIRNPRPAPNFSGKIPVSEGTAKLTLSTFNPASSNPGYSFWGSEIDSHERFALPDSGNGIAFAARVRWPKPLPRGIVTALFAFGLTHGKPCDFKDEIDLEMLSNYIQSPVNPPKIMLNWYRDEPPGIGRPILVDTPGLDLTKFNQFEIHWYKDRVEWFINDTLIQRVTDHIPTGPMSVRLNIWVPAADFSMAFGHTLQPARHPEQNRDFIFEVDWVKVSLVTAHSE